MDIILTVFVRSFLFMHWKFVPICTTDNIFILAQLFLLEYSNLNTLFIAERVKWESTNQEYLTYTYAHMTKLMLILGILRQTTDRLDGYNG